jgi:hypothetical protein
MAVSSLRIAACAGVLVCGLILGNSSAWLASADPGDNGYDRGDTESSKIANYQRPSLNRVINRILSEHRRRIRNEPRSAPRPIFGSEPDSSFTASEPSATTLVEPDVEPSPDRVDNTAVSGPAEAEEKPSKSPDYPFPIYLLELRRGRGDWWNADRIVSRLSEAIMPYLATTPEPEPEPEPAPAPAFRGPAPEAPAPDPVLDASGGIAAGSGSDYQATGFGGAPVLTAPIVAIPVLPPAAARFPAFPPATAPAPALGVGSAAARGGSEELALTASTVRQAGSPQGPSGTITSMGGQAPRRGYTDYPRSPGLPQLAGAALPGVAGILLMTLAGGVVGYRQANAGRMIRSSAAARYLP